MKYDKTIYALSESVEKEKFVICTYYCECKTADLLLKAGSMAVEQTTGTWVQVPLETPEVRQKHVGRLIGVYEVPHYEFALPEDIKERKFIFRLAFPIINMGEQIPELLSTVSGNIMNGGKLKLLDIEFPESFIKKFKGPKFGVDGIREILDVKDRPMTLGMIKPCTGCTPVQCGEVVYELGMGGIDIVKDDELLGDTEYCSCKDRFIEVMKAVKKIKEETGKTVLYAMNITDRPDRMLEKALWAVRNGANALMINIQAAGYGAFQMVSEHPEINVPMLAHPAFSGVLYESEYSGLASHLVIGKLSRMSGADMVVYPCAYGKLKLLREAYIRIAQTLQAPFYHLKPSLPSPAAGVHPGLLPTIAEDIGTDFLIGAGGAMHGHPMGPAAGVIALTVAGEAIVKGIDLKVAAETSKELEVALKTWGLVADENNKIYELER